MISILSAPSGLSTIRRDHFLIGLSKSEVSITLVISCVIDGEVLSIVLSCAKLYDHKSDIILHTSIQQQIINKYLRIIRKDYRLKYYNLLYRSK